MDNKSYQPPTFFITTNTTSSRGADTSNNAPPCNNNGPYLRQLNKHSNNISKSITKNLSNNIIPRPITKNHGYHKNRLTQLQPPPPPPVYKITKSEFKDFVQRVTGCTPKIIAPPPPIKIPNPPSTRLLRIRPPPLMPINNLPPPPPPLLNTTFVGPNNPINPMTMINPINDVVAATPPLFPLPPFPSVSVGVESHINSYLHFVNDTVLSSPVPLLSPSILFSPQADQVGFPQLVPNPGWNDVKI